MLQVTDGGTGNRRSSAALNSSVSVDGSRVGAAPALSQGVESVDEPADTTPISPELAFVWEASGRDPGQTGLLGPGRSGCLAGDEVVGSRDAGVKPSTGSWCESPSGDIAASGVILDDTSVVVGVHETVPNDAATDVASVPAVAVSVADGDRAGEQDRNGVTGDDLYDML